MRLLAVDPGTVQTAILIYDTDCPIRPIVGAWIVQNEDLINRIHSFRTEHGCEHMAIEMIASYGASVGASIFITCYWIGRFIQAWGDSWTWVYRREVKTVVCGTQRANDTSVRGALLTRWGGKEAAIGNKAAPGPLYGIKKDEWSALGVAVAWVHKYLKPVVAKDS